jgi:hypothetical protein
LDSVINKVDQQIRVIKSLSPDSFTLDNLYDELATMAIIRALPNDFDGVIRTISVLDVFDKQKVIISGLRNMDDNSRHLSSARSMLYTNTTAPNRPAASSQGPTSSNTSTNRPKCNFCSKLGHLEAKCFLKEKLMKMILQAANSVVPAAPGAPQTASISSASPLHALSLQPSAYTCWNADTGASSHMTPHRHWLRNYKPYHIEIKLADGKSIYSEGVGSVQFEPMIDGKVGPAVEFTNVLHVPSLQNNLLSVLYLSMNRNFDIHIIKDTMFFNRDNKTLFEAKVTSNISAFQGNTIPLEECAHLSSSTTLPMDLDLWH